MEVAASISSPPPLHPSSSPPCSTTNTSFPILPHLNPLAQPFSPTLPWSKTLFKLPHIPISQKLTYSAPLRKEDRVVACCSKEEVDKTSETWKDALQGFFADKRPFLPSVIAALERKWKLKEAMEVFPRPDGSLIFLFNSLDERKTVLDSGPWFVMGKYLHIKPWNRITRSRKDFFSSLPVWVHLPNLPLHLWSPGSIGKIASVIGNPLYLDENSANYTKISYARVCIEISADEPPPSSVRVEVGGTNESYDQLVEFETTFKVCNECKVFGHIAENCSKASLMKPTVRGIVIKPGLARATAPNSSKQIDKTKSDRDHELVWTKVLPKNKLRNKSKDASTDPTNSSNSLMQEPFEHQFGFKVGKKKTAISGNRFGPISEGLMEKSIMDEPESSLKCSYFPGNQNFFPATGNNQEDAIISMGDGIPQNGMGADTLLVDDGELTNNGGDLTGFSARALPARDTFSTTPGPATKVVNQALLPGSDSEICRSAEMVSTAAFQYEAGTLMNFKPVGTVDSTQTNSCLSDGLMEKTTISALDICFSKDPVITLVEETTSGAKIDDLTVGATCSSAKAVLVDSSSFAFESTIVSSLPNTTITSRAKTSVDPYTFLSPTRLPSSQLSANQPNPSLPNPPNTHTTFSLSNHSSSGIRLPTQAQTQNPSLDQTQAQRPSLGQTQPTSNKAQTQSPSLEVSSEESDEEMDFSIPLGFTPDREDMNDLRELMKERVVLVPPEHQKEFITSVDLAEDGEILDFFQQKAKEKSKTIEDTNYLTYRNVRCSPRLKKKPAKLADSPRSSGLKKGFLK